MKKILFSLFFVSLPLSASAAALFEREIDISSISGDTNVLLAIPESVLLYQPLDLLRITNNGSPVAIKAVSQEHGTFLGIISQVNLCSLEAGNRASAVHDGSTATVAKPDPFKNPSTCSIEIKFSVPVRVDSVNIQADQSLKKLIVSARNTSGNRTQLRESFNSSSTTFSSVITDALTLSLSYDLVPSISEIVVNGQIPARILFNAIPGNRYALVYGDAAPTSAPAPTNALFSTNVTPFVSAGPEKSVSGDGDGDGIVAATDNCPTVRNADQKDSDSDGLGDVCDNAPYAANAPQNDQDHDGVGDIQDNCRSVFNPDQKDEDLDGIGFACDDADGDRTMNSKDNCPRLANANQLDSDGNGVGDACELDRDGDMLADEKDNCRNDHNPEQEDADGDRIGDLCDSCPETSNPNQEDRNDNGIGDACETALQDPDGDGINNSSDNCIATANPSQTDTDNDKKGDACDNCPTLKNTNQRDSDKDGQGDVCTDQDGDGFLPHIDNCPSISNADQRDRNNNGKGDVCEDNDNDGILNANDNCPYKSNRNQKDEDADGMGNACDEADDRFSEQHEWILWVGISAIVFVIVSMAVRMIVQVKKESNGDFR